jgi:hypothetical protein
MTHQIRLHGIPLSGHVHKVELFLRLLELPFDPPDGGVDLSAYPAVEAWIARVEALPRAKPMPRAA